MMITMTIIQEGVMSDHQAIPLCDCYSRDRKKDQASL